MPRLTLCLSTFSLLAAAVLSPAGERGPCVLRLAESARVDRRVVTLGDLIVQDQPQSAAIQQLSAIDLVERSSAAEEQVVSRELIALRLRLAGYSADELSLVGPDAVRITSSAAAVGIELPPLPLPATTVTPPQDAAAVEPPPQAINDSEIEAAVTQTISSQMGVPPEELRVTLTSPVSERLTLPASSAALRWDVTPLGDRLLGRVNCLFRLFEDQSLSQTQQVSVLVERQQSVLVATVSLDRGDVIQPAMFREETRFVTEPIDELSAEQVRERLVRTPVRPGQVLSRRHLEAEAKAGSAVVVQPRQAVRVTVKKRGMRVELRDARALEAGRVGETIHVRNESSNRVMTAVVTGPGLVEVPLP